MELKYEDIPENLKYTPLHFASANGDAREVGNLLKLGSSEIEAKTFQKNTALNLAANKGHADVVRKLLAAGAEVDTRDQINKTPLHNAACWGHADVVKILLAAGADKDAKESERGFTALIYAAGNGYSTVVQMLLAAGANTEAWTTDHDPTTALHLACVHGHEEVVKRLIAAGANIHASGDGVMPLHSAATGGQGGVVQILLAAGAILDPECERRPTPSVMAEMAGHLQIVAMIREEKRRRATLKACEVCGTQTSLRCACKKVAFCKRDCMKIGWKTHKLSCRGKNKSSKSTA
uniref:MYND-type domain-containing protein n=1 Tax=Heterosigma akashiwo TaxID=2829 RepID=A0A7S4DDF9_HETAK